jgi:hypothetical protein
LLLASLNNFLETSRSESVGLELALDELIEAIFSHV